MKKIAVLIALLAVGLCADSIEKKGFLTSKWCAENGYFSDCRLESLVCGSGECFKSWEFGDTVTDELVLFVHDNKKLPVVNFAAGGVATPADAALMMQLGAEGVFVGSGIFKSGNPEKRAAAIVKAVTNFTDAKLKKNQLTLKLPSKSVVTIELK